MLQKMRWVGVAYPHMLGILPEEFVVNTLKFGLMEVGGWLGKDVCVGGRGAHHARWLGILPEEFVLLPTQPPT